MAARITRAKKKIAAARIPYRVPSAARAARAHRRRARRRAPALHDRAHRAGRRRPACAATWSSALARPGPDAAHAAARRRRRRRPARADPADRRPARHPRRPHRRLVLLAEQDRSAVGRGRDRRGRSRWCARRCDARPPGRYALQAAIAAVHAEAPTWEATDWAEIVGALRRAAADLAVAGRGAEPGRRGGLRRRPAGRAGALDALAAEPQLAGYGYLAAARADFLRRLDRSADARLAYEEALLLTENAVERRFLLDRIATLER